LTLSDIQDRLVQDHALSGTDVEVLWKEGESAGRMKELGTREVLVKLREGGQEEVSMEVEVVRVDGAL
jgi:hypothetical protein